MLLGLTQSLVPTPSVVSSIVRDSSICSTLICPLEPRTGVHTTDGVPTIIPTYYGYRHHSTEYWQTVDPSSAANVKKCTGDEGISGVGHKLGLGGRDYVRRHRIVGRLESTIS